MVNVAYIYLHKDPTEEPTEICFKAARVISSHIRQLKDEDYEYLDPIISVRHSSNIFYPPGARLKSWL